MVIDRLEDRWHRRQKEERPEFVPVAVSEQVTVMGVDPDRLWQLVWDPATSSLVLDDVVSAFTLPGTPAGKVGEMQIHIVAGAGGTLVGVIEEVVELGPGYRAVTRSRSTAMPSTSKTVILPLDQSGCVLRHSIQVTVPAEAANTVREETQANTQRYLSRIRDLAASCVRHPLGER